VSGSGRGASILFKWHVNAAQNHNQIVRDKGMQFVHTGEHAARGLAADAFVPHFQHQTLFLKTAGKPGEKSSLGITRTLHRGGAEADKITHYGNEVEQRSAKIKRAVTGESGGPAKNAKGC